MRLIQAARRREDAGLKEGFIGIEIAKASDTEGKIVTLAKIESYGSRPRSAYHLCNALHDVIAIVVSQDGNVQLAKWRNGIVTCWHLTTQMFIGET